MRSINAQKCCLHQKRTKCFLFYISALSTKRVKDNFIFIGITLFGLLEWSTKFTQYQKGITWLYMLWLYDVGGGIIFNVLLFNCHRGFHKLKDKTHYYTIITGHYCLLSGMFLFLENINISHDWIQSDWFVGFYW